MKIIITAFVLLLCHSASLARAGIADWGRKTPGGNEINNYADNATLYLKNGTTLPGIAKWYFYKNHIVGLTRANALFIVDEGTCDISEISKGDFLFTGQISNEVLSRKQLEPALYTRSYDSDWQTSAISNFILLLIFWPYVTVPAIAAYLWLLYGAIRHRMSLLSPYTKVMIVISAYLIIDFLLDLFPQSI